jgi:hypothetical protein
MDEGFAGREAPFEDHQMWRLLLARLHPDTGGDHELFLFACALREEVCGYGRPDAAEGGHPAEPFLRAWHEAMGRWAAGNRRTLKTP